MSRVLGKDALLIASDGHFSKADWLLGYRLVCGNAILLLYPCASLAF